MTLMSVSFKFFYFMRCLSPILPGLSFFRSRTWGVGWGPFKTVEPTKGIETWRVYSKSETVSFEACKVDR